MYFHPISALKVSVGCPLHSWRGQEHPWHWAEQEAPTLRQILAELGAGSRDLSVLSHVQGEHWLMQEPLESALAADTHPLPFPLPHHATKHRRGKWLLRAVTIFKSSSSLFVTGL